MIRRQKKFPMNNNHVKEQFNRQADKYASSTIGKNDSNLSNYFDFCQLKAGDRLLDVACGTGEFVIYSAPKVREARGVDISDREIEISRELAGKLANQLFSPRSTLGCIN